MQWSPDRNAGFSTASPQKLYLPVIIEPEYHFQSVNVENQVRNPSSLLWWLRRVIAMRRRLLALGLGSLEFLHSDNPKVLTFLRSYEDENLLVVVNLSRYSQVVQIDLSLFAGQFPVEVFSRNRYPIIREVPYVLTLGVFDYYWFSLKKEPEKPAGENIPGLVLKKGEPWHAILRGKNKARLEDLLSAYLPGCRWFRSKARHISGVALLDAIPLLKTDFSPRLLLFQVRFTEGAPECYVLPLSWTKADSADSLLAEFPQARVAALQIGEEPGWLIDAIYQQEVRDLLLQLLAGRKKLKGEGGELAPLRGAGFRASAIVPSALSSRVLNTEQSNSSILYGERFFFKLFRKAEQGINPDLEITRFLFEKTTFRHIPPYAGALEYRRSGEAPMTIALLQDYVPNQGDAWQFSKNVLDRFLEQLLAHRSELPQLRPQNGKLPEKGKELLGSFYLEMIALLGVRTAEMHLALASETRDPAWRPEAFSTLYQRSVYQSMRNLARRSLLQLRQVVKGLPEETATVAREVLAAEKDILARLRCILKQKLDAMKIRIHGDFHLGQVLFTGKDFVIIDFEGEPARALTERRLKRSVLRDVAGMLRSFHYAFKTSLQCEALHWPENLPLLEEWLQSWYETTSETFLEAYRGRLGDARLVPRDPDQFRVLLDSFLLEKALYELGYELNNRPDWALIPLKGILAILQSQQEETGGEGS
jgi:maltose alpha-D-glucosyltransferase/alpha-amylase